MTAGNGDRFAAPRSRSSQQARLLGLERRGVWRCWEGTRRSRRPARLLGLEGLGVWRCWEGARRSRQPARLLGLEGFGVFLALLGGVSAFASAGSAAGVGRERCSSGAAGRGLGVRVAQRGCSAGRSSVSGALGRGPSVASAGSAAGVGRRGVWRPWEGTGVRVSPARLLGLEGPVSGAVGSGPSVASPSAAAWGWKARCRALLGGDSAVASPSAAAGAGRARSLAHLGEDQRSRQPARRDRAGRADPHCPTWAVPTSRRRASRSAAAVSAHSVVSSGQGGPCCLTWAGRAVLSHLGRAGCAVSPGQGGLSVSPGQGGRCCLTWAEPTPRLGNTGCHVTLLACSAGNAAVSHSPASSSSTPPRLAGAGPDICHPASGWGNCRSWEPRRTALAGVSRGLPVASPGWRGCIPLSPWAGRSPLCHCSGAGSAVSPGRGGLRLSHLGRAVPSP